MVFGSCYFTTTISPDFLVDKPCRLDLANGPTAMYADRRCSKLVPPSSFVGPSRYRSERRLKSFERSLIAAGNSEPGSETLNPLMYTPAQACAQHSLEGQKLATTSAFSATPNAQLTQVDESEPKISFVTEKAAITSGSLSHTNTISISQPTLEGSRVHFTLEASAATSGEAASPLSRTTSFRSQIAERVSSMNNLDELLAYEGLPGSLQDKSFLGHISSDEKPLPEMTQMNGPKRDRPDDCLDGRQPEGNSSPVPNITNPTPPAKRARRRTPTAQRSPNEAQLPNQTPVELAKKQIKDSETELRTLRPRKETALAELRVREAAELAAEEQQALAYIRGRRAQTHTAMEAAIESKYEIQEKLIADGVKEVRVCLGISSTSIGLADLCDAARQWEKGQVIAGKVVKMQRVLATMISEMKGSVDMENRDLLPEER